MKNKIITKLACVLYLALGLAAGAESNAAAETIRQFYKQYLAYDYFKTPNLSRPKIRMSKSFSAEIKRNGEICAQYVSGICGWGSEGDEYLDTQEIDPKLTYKNSGMKIKEIGPNLIQVKLNVYPSVKDAKGYYDKTITYKMANENGVWVVDDIMYSDGISSRKKLAEENEYAVANSNPDAPAARKDKK